MSDTDRILERVRKMLTLANDAGATEGERDNALRMAHATLAKYNLDLAALEAQGKKSSEERVIERTKYFGRPWARIVSSAVAELFFCEYLYGEATRANDTLHVFVGKKSNAATAIELARWLVATIAKEGKRRQREAAAGNVFYRSFATGAAYKVLQRAREIRLAAERPHDSSPGTAIVLASVYRTESDANKALIAEQMRVRSAVSKGSNRYDREALGAGAEYGSTLSLNRQLGKGN